MGNAGSDQLWHGAEYDTTQRQLQRAGNVRLLARGGNSVDARYADIVSDLYAN